MAGALAGGTIDAAAPASRLPHPRQLAALGTVLCLYRPHHGSELSGWVQAVRAESRAGMDSDGLRESLVFFDAEGRCCWRLYLLPDSDFLAWDRVLEALPADERGEPSSGVSERLWRRLAGRLFGESWQACALNLHVLPVSTASPPVLAASLAPLSALGLSTARRIAHAEGAEESLRVDDCCCAQASLAATRSFARSNTEPQFATRASGLGPMPLVRLNPRKP